MRVIAGSARRLKLVSPPGEETRPTQDIIKETLFNMIQNEVPGSVFVDLFAGSGGIGIEALSRGAKKAYFVEYAQAPLKCLIQNLETTRLGASAVILKSDVLASLSRIREREADIVYMDPPYETGLCAQVIRALGSQPWMTPYTTVIAESALHTDFSFALHEGFVITKEKCYKNNKHVFLRIRQEAEETV